MACFAFHNYVQVSCGHDDQIEEIAKICSNELSRTNYVRDGDITDDAPNTTQTAMKFRDKMAQQAFADFTAHTQLHRSKAVFLARLQYPGIDEETIFNAEVTNKTFQANIYEDDNDNNVASY